MPFTPESLKRQNEFVRTLQKELAEKERELANEKWVFNQFLQSPSWKLTYPIRWLARQWRTIKEVLSGSPRTGEPRAPIEPAPAGEKISPAEARFVSDFKKVLTSHYRTLFETFLISEARLDVPASDDPEISVILVLFNRSELTFACLRSIAENYSARLEVILVDNASSDETPLLLDRLRGARIIRNPENRHFLLAVNQAAEQARGKYILLLNNDAQLLPGALSSALERIQSAVDIGAVGGKVILLDGTLQEAGSIIWKDGSCLGYGRGDTPFAPAYMFPRDVDYCSGAFLLTPRTLWLQLGGFDEAFKPAYYEETDYCMRLRQRGYRVVYEPGASILHYEFASSQSIVTAIELQSAHQRIFSARHRPALDKHETADLGRAIFARMRHSGRRVLFLDDRVPHCWLGSGFPRANAFIRALLKHDCFVTMYPLSVFNEDWVTIYSDLPREVEVMTGAGPAMLELFLKNRRGYYDVIIVSRPHNMKILQAIIASYPEWFEDTHLIYDAEAVFAYRDAGLRKLSGDPMPSNEFEEALRAEIDLASNADCIVAVSNQDGEAFRRHSIKNVSILGHSLAPTPTTQRFDERAGLLFVGAIHEEASPNGDSVIWFLTEIFPRIQERLGNHISFTIAGVNLSERIRQLAGPAVRITGHLEDLTSLYGSARIMVAPTRYSAGIPHKIHEAAAHGLPVVATSLLAAQLDWTDRELACGDTADEFAARCIEVYSTPEKWTKLRDAALKRVIIECSQETFERTVHGLLNAEHLPHQSTTPGFVNVGMDG